MINIILKYFYVTKYTGLVKISIFCISLYQPHLSFFNSAIKLCSRFFFIRAKVDKFCILPKTGLWLTSKRAILVKYWSRIFCYFDMIFSSKWVREWFFWLCLRRKLATHSKGSNYACQSIFCCQCTKALHTFPFFAHAKIHKITIEFNETKFAPKCQDKIGNFDNFELNFRPFLGYFRLKIGRMIIIFDSSCSNLFSVSLYFASLSVQKVSQFRA